MSLTPYKIKKISKIGKRKTYDLQVRKNNNFFLTNGILSHNSGKSVSIKSILEGFHDNRSYKVWDLFGGERNEGLYWALKSQDKMYWEKLKILGKFTEEGPKQYRVNFLYPLFNSNAANISKLPKLEQNGEIIVNSKVFTLPLKEITIDDIKMVLGNASSTGEFIWDEIQRKLKRGDNVGALSYYSKKIKCEQTLLYKNFILPMIEEEFLREENADTNLDLIAEAKDVDVITVLCLDFVPEKFHLFVLNYFCKRLSEYLDENLIPKRNIGFIREAATFFRELDANIVDDRLKIFKSNMAHYIRMGRRGFYFALDCQSPTETRGLVEGAQDYLLMFRTTSTRDKDEMCGELIKTGRMRRDQSNELDLLEKGQCFVAETGSTTVKKIQVILPRSAYWRKEYPNFYKTLWESRGGQWKIVKDVLQDNNDKILKVKEIYDILLKEEKDEDDRDELTDEDMDDENDAENIGNDVINDDLPRIKHVIPRKEEEETQIPSFTDLFGRK